MLSVMASETLVSSSPRTRLAAGEDYDLETSRASLVVDLNHADEVQYDWFLKYILPYPDRLSKKVDLDKAIGHLKSKGHLIRIDGEDRWKDFAKATPSRINSSEPIVFKKLVGMFNAIRDAALAQDPALSNKQLLEFTSTPGKTPQSNYVVKTAPPDGHFVRKQQNGGSELNWMDVAVCAQFKKAAETSKVHAIDNRRKLCWDMYRVLREDPRHRFVLGFTISDSALRFWFGSRSEFLASTKINFITDIKPFVHFAISVMFAEEDEVGWDPTMKLISQDDKPPMYDISVHSDSGQSTIVYRTKTLLNDYGALALCGRGTRVWTARRMDARGAEMMQKDSEVVLKDSWADAKRSREGEIFKMIKESDTSQVFQAGLKTHFIAPTIWSDVFIKGQPDHTRELLTRGQEPVVRTPISLARDHRKHDGNSLLLGTSNIMKHNIKEHFHDKMHTRTVFPKAYQSLNDQAQLWVVFAALVDIVKALRLLHNAGHGWVHRDVSAGNILIPQEYKESIVSALALHTQWASHAILSDLEYAKAWMDTTALGFRSGTSDFTALEVSTRAYMHIASRRTKGTRSQDSDPLPFRHNALHDLESVLWVALSFLVKGYLTMKVNSQDSESTFNSKREFVNTDIFHRTSGRTATMIGYGVMKEHLKSALPPSLSLVVDAMEAMRRELIAQYQTAETDVRSIKKDVAGELYDVFIEELLEAAQVLQAMEVEIMPRSAGTNAEDFDSDDEV